MNVCIEILIPAIPSITGLEFIQEIYYWDGVGYPQDEYYKWGSAIRLKETVIPDYLKKYIPKGYFPDGFVVLTFSPKVMRQWADDIYGEEVEWGGFTLEGLLSALLEKSQSWMFFLSLQCEQIDTIYTCSVTEFMGILRNNLSPKYRYLFEGFIAIGVSRFHPAHSSL